MFDKDISIGYNCCKDSSLSLQESSVRKRALTTNINIEKKIFRIDCYFWLAEKAKLCKMIFNFCSDKCTTVKQTLKTCYTSVTRERERGDNGLFITLVPKVLW